jgi:hypothetical protein
VAETSCKSLANISEDAWFEKWKETEDICLLNYFFIYLLGKTTAIMSCMK